MRVTPSHVKDGSLRPLFADPEAAWTGHALTTWLKGNHSIRTEQWRYTRYADGSEELYDEQKDPYEWTNVAKNSEFDSLKSEFSKQLPTENKPATGKPGGNGKGNGRKNAANPDEND